MGNPIVERVLRDSAARIEAADAKAHEAGCAFQAGKFEEFFNREFERVKKAVHDEYERTADRSELPGGSGEETG
jgi:hypothetical protein